jgi:hypothetical protein
MGTTNATPRVIFIPALDSSFRPDVGGQRYVQVTGFSGAKAEEPNVRVSPYYSINPTDPDVHHVHSDCPSGKQIPPI